MNYFVGTALAILLLTILAISFSSMHRTVKHTKSFRGFMRLNSEFIELDEEIFLWSDVSSIRISLKDIKGNVRVEDVLLAESGEKYLSPGVSNNIKVALKNNTQYEFNFEIQSEEHKSKFKEVLVKAVELNEVNYKLTE